MLLHLEWVCRQHIVQCWWCGCNSVILCPPQQGPQGFTGPPGEPGEAGPSVSMQNIIKQAHLPCTLVNCCRCQLLLVLFYRVPWVPAAPLDLLERMERMWVNWMCPFSIYLSQFSIKDGAIQVAKPFRLPLIILGRVWQTRSCWWAWTSWTSGEFSCP